MRCVYCRREYSTGVYQKDDPNHHADCPDKAGLSTEEAKKRRTAFWIGHKEGQTLDQPNPLDAVNPQYMMGFGEGICAVEERENGYNPYAPGNDPGPWG